MSPSPAPTPCVNPVVGGTCIERRLEEEGNGSSNGEADRRVLFCRRREELREGAGGAEAGGRQLPYDVDVKCSCDGTRVFGVNGSGCVWTDSCTCTPGATVPYLATCNPCG